MFIKLQHDSDSEDDTKEPVVSQNKEAENIALDPEFERITDYEAHMYPKRARGSDINYISLWSFLAIRRSIPRRAFPKSLKVIWFLDWVPTEVTLLILEYLSPYDLYHLSKANKALYRLIGSHFFASRWAYAFRDTCYPSCPPDVSWPFWTDLLFSQRLRCHKCENPGRVIDIGLWCHWCRDCPKTELVDNAKLGIIGPDISMLGYELVPRSAQFRGNGNLVAQTTFFSRKAYTLEVMKRTEAITAFAGRNSGEMRQWRKQQSELVSVHQKIHGQFLQWINVAQSMDKERKERQIKKVQLQIMKRFVEMGYEQDDLKKEFMFMLRFMEDDLYPKLTEKVWLEVKEKLEPVAKMAREERKKATQPSQSGSEE